MSQKKKQGPVKPTGKTPETGTKPLSAGEKPANAPSNPVSESRKTAKISPKGVTEVVQTVPDFFDNLGNKAQWVALGLILFIGFIVFKDFLLFDKVYLFKDIGSDTLNYAYPYAHTVAEYIGKYGIPKWSFNFGVGQSLFPFFLRDPFDIIIYIAGKDHLAYAMIYKEFAKIVLGGFVFYYYLKTLKLSEFTSITGSLLFAYSGFMIVGSGWYIFSFEAFNMALLLLAYEKLFQRQKWGLFIFAIFLICISQPFNLFIYGVFFVSYVFLRFYQTETFSWKNIGSLFLKVAGLGILAILLSGPFMLENVVQLLESPRGSGNTSYVNMFSHAPMFAVSEIIELGTSVMRFFSSDILGTGNDFLKGIPSNSNTLEAPMFYCGLTSLLLMPQVFQFLTTRVKIAFLILIAVWVFPIIFPYFRYAFWLFTGNYFRGYSIIVSFFFMYYSLFALDMILQRRKINLIILILTVIALFGLLNYPYFPDKEVINPSIYAFVSIMIIAYAALLYFMSRATSPLYLKYIFLGLVAFELTYLSNISVNARDTMTAAEVTSKDKGYNDYTVDAVNYIKQTDHSFYRIDKVYGSSPAMHYSINDGMAQDYMGTSGYSPFNEISYVLYLQLVGIANKENELQSRWAVGVAYRPILESENQGRYLLTKGPVNYVMRTSCDSLTTIGNVRIYRNKYYLPLGYTYNRFIRESVYRRFSNDQKDFVSLRACVVNDDDVNKLAGLKDFLMKDTVSLFSFGLYKEFTDSLRKDSLTITHFSPTDLKGKIDLTEDKMMYLSIPMDKGWRLTVDGKPQEKITLFAGMTGVMLTKGQHLVEMNYELRFFKQGVYLSIMGLLLLGGLWIYMKKRREEKQGSNQA